MQSLPTGFFWNTHKMETSWLSVLFMEHSKVAFLPKLQCSSRETIGLRASLLLNSQSKYNASPQPLPLPQYTHTQTLSAFMHPFVLAFLFLLRNDSFHLCLCFYSLPKESFLLKAPEYKGGIFMSLVHWNKNVMPLPLKNIRTGQSDIQLLIQTQLIPRKASSKGQKFTHTLRLGEADHVSISRILKFVNVV